MNYIDVVEKEIEGDDEDLNRRKKLWGIISEANQQGGVDAVKDALADNGKTIANEFEDLLEKLNKVL